MLKYLIAFSLYTFAMVGILLIAYLVWKKVSDFSSSKKDGGMKIEDALRLSNRKILYIVNVRNERFLIASDQDRTTFLAKLEGKSGINVEHINQAIENTEEKELSRNLNTVINSNDVQKQEDKTKMQIEEYIKELEALDIIEKSAEEDDYSNAVDISSRNTNNVLKNILKELRDSKKGRV